jgi:phosphate transport system protein
MADVVSNMVRQGIMAFVLRDSKMAHVIVSHDNRVDGLFLAIKTDLLDLFGKDNEKHQEILESIMIAKYLERVGDYTVNIVESVIELLR